MPARGAAHPMNLKTIIPRPLDPSSCTECVALFRAALTRAYFSRAHARRLGWRGVRPCGGPHSTWTLRVAGSNHVFGLRFDGEQIHNQKIHGCFSLYIFPQHAEDPLWERLPLEALRRGLSPQYAETVRDFARHETWAAPFGIGWLHMEAALDGSFFRVALEAMARWRVRALDGICTNNGQWVIPPGGKECDVPQYRLGLHLMGPLVQTYTEQLEQTPYIRVRHTSHQATAYTKEGSCADPELTEHCLLLTADFGADAAASAIFLADDAYAAPGATIPVQRKIAHLPKYSEDTTQDMPVLHILTGFLGSGKTTFLRAWLDYLNGRERYTGVIQNEFGQVALDATLLGTETCVEALGDGCVCCSLSDSLRPGIERLKAAMPTETLILETTGLANPQNILPDLRDLSDIINVGLVITVVDCGQVFRAPEDFATQGVLHDQVAGADVLLLNKTDIVPDNALLQAEACLKAINPRALLLRAQRGNVPYAALDAFFDEHSNSHLPSRRPCLEHMSVQTHATHSTKNYSSFALTQFPPLTRRGISALLTRAGNGLCRVKGIVHLTDGANGIARDAAAVVQYAGGQLQFEPAPKNNPDGDYLIFIGRDITPFTLG